MTQLRTTETSHPLAKQPEERGAIGIALIVWLLGGGLGLAVLVFVLLKLF